MSKRYYCIPAALGCKEYTIVRPNGSKAWNVRGLIKARNTVAELNANLDIIEGTQPMANYVEITLEEMKEVLSIDKGWREIHRGNEYVFEWSMPVPRAHLVVRARRTANSRPAWQSQGCRLWYRRDR